MNTASETHIESDSKGSPDMLPPFVSVIVPAFNERDVIRQCVEALLSQDYPADRREIIIVDNNSADGTDQIAKEYAVTLLYEREIQTSYAARNRGIRQAQGDIVAFTDADCVPQPDWLSQLVIPFRDARVVGVAGAVQCVGSGSLLDDFQAELRPMSSRQMGGLWYVVTANVAFRRDALLSVGLFQSHLYTAQDTDLGLRLQLKGFGRIEGAPQAIVRHPFDGTWADLCERSRRYGYGEILLDTLYRNEAAYFKSPREQFAIMLRQLKALAVYAAAFVYRACKSAFSKWDSRYVAWPVLWFVTEGNNLWGKLRGIVATRFFTQVPKRPHKA